MKDRSVAADGRGRGWRAAAGLFAAALLIAGCSAGSRLFVSAPPIADTGTWVPGKVVWHDLVTPDVAGAKEFYAGVFGWTFEDLSSGYALARNGDRVIGGIAALAAATAGSQWIAQVSVSDIDAATGAARRAGGAVLLGPFDLRGRGQVAVVRDPQAAIFGVIQTVNGDPAAAEPRPGDFLWHEVWAADPDAVAPFYQQVLGFTTANVEIGGLPYRVFERDGTARVGLQPKPQGMNKAAWASYVRVADIDASVARVTRFGGRVLFAPRPDVRQGSVAVVMDRSGAGLLLQQWPIGG